MSDKLFLNLKTKRSNSSPELNKRSKGSDDYIFSNTNNSAYTKKHISKFEIFLGIISEIKNPCYTTDEEFLKNAKMLEELEKQDNYDKQTNLPISLDSIDKQKIFPIEPIEFFRNDFKSKTGNFIFSNLFSEEEKNEQKIFDTIHNFCNGYYSSCEIPEFCPDYKLHFPNNDCIFLCPINEDEFYVESMKVFHYHDYGIGHFYSPKGTGKSILFRSIFMNFVKLNDDRYTPLMFFNIRLLNELIETSDLSKLKKVFLHDLYALFKTREDSLSFMAELDFTKKNIMSIVLETIKKAISEIKEKRKVFIIDNYSTEFDKENILKDVIDLVYSKKNFFVEIVYTILNPKDSELLYKNLNSEHHINYNVNYTEKYYYFEKLKLFSMIRNNFEGRELFDTYASIFGENVSFLFEFNSKNIKFDEFVKLKKGEIKNEMLNFFSGDCKLFLNQIIDYIESKKKFLYDEIIKYVPGNYVDIIIEPKPDPKCWGDDIKKEKFPKYYTLNYSFPLIKEIMMEISSGISFINMKNPQFLKSPGPTLGINFDNELIKILKGLVDKEYFFEFKKKKKIFVEDILEKFYKDEKKRKDLNQLYQNAILKMYQDNDILFQKELFDKTNFFEYDCIAVFQNSFFGKAFDALFIIKKEGDKHYNIILLQIKCSDDFKENIGELRLQAQYVKEKFSFLLNISVINTYVSYISIAQKPKAFAEKFRNKTFLYDIQRDKFVNFDGKEYEKFPILNDSIIYFNFDFEIVEKIKNDLIMYHKRKIILIKKELNWVNSDKNNLKKIEDKLKNNEVYVHISAIEFNYYYKLDNIFQYTIKKVNNFYDKLYDALFSIK
jgi:hypothetical protein